jgi:hypothetical protein
MTESAGTETPPISASVQPPTRVSFGVTAIIAISSTLVVTLFLATIGVGSYFGIMYGFGAVAFGASTGPDYAQGAPAVDTDTGTDTDTDTGITDGSVNEEPLPEPSQTQEPTTQETGSYSFRSESGNIRCVMSAEGVACYIKNFDFKRPSASCKSGLKGVSVAVSQQGAFWPCLDKGISASRIVGYKVKVEKYGYRCRITYEYGVKCLNEYDQGFTLEYSRGAELF